MDLREHPHYVLTGQVITAAQKVYDHLGSGFAERIYENALAIELDKTEILYQRQFPIKVYYDAQVVGEYVADLLVSEVVMVELKALPKLLDVHTSQLLNYMRASKTPTGLLINFGDRFEVKRRVY